MYSSDQSVLITAKKWLSQVDEILLVTVCSTWGSSPRPIGSMMVVHPDGDYVGSVSGGCIEEDLVDKFLSGEFKESKVYTRSYGVGQIDAQKFGLPCGGKLDLIIERLISFESLRIAERASRENSPVARAINIHTGEISYSDADWNDKSFFDSTHLHKIFGPQWKILIIGGNELANVVANLSCSLDYQVIVCDPREYSSPAWLTSNMTFTNKMPDDVVLTLQPVEHSIVLALTHDPKMDDMALMQALKMDFFYVGAIGSTKTQAARRKRLLTLDLSSEEISKLHGPVGLNIGSKTPQEIAISILAQITLFKNQVRIESTNSYDATLKLA